MASEIDENKLARMLADPNRQREAFSMAVEQYGEQLYWRIRRMVLSHDDANDVLQNAFVKAWNKLGSFQNKSRFSTWLYRIAINEALDFLRRQKLIRRVSADDDEGVASRLMDDDYFDGNRAEALLQEAIATLPEVQRMVFNLRYFEEMKYSDMSKLLNTSEGALKASYHFAVKKIKKYVEES